MAVKTIRPNFIIMSPLELIYIILYKLRAFLYIASLYVILPIDLDDYETLLSNMDHNFYTASYGQYE
jgi:hypothetical protein